MPTGFTTTFMLMTQQIWKPAKREDQFMQDMFQKL